MLVEEDNEVNQFVARAILESAGLLVSLVGMNDHVVKPIDPTTLFGTLLQWVGCRSDRPPKG